LGRSATRGKKNGWRKLSDSHTGRFTTVTGPRYTLRRGLGGPQRHSERFGEEIFFLPLLGIEPRFLIFEPVAYSLYK